DEALAGSCDYIKVILHSDGSCSVGDNGRGIPVDIHKESGKPAAEVVLTVLHSGGKFDHSAYKVSGGLHGVGISVVNALSEWLEVEIRRDGKEWTQRYELGVPTGSLTATGTTKKTGTIIRFKPAAAIFEDTTFSFDTLTSTLSNYAQANGFLKNFKGGISGDDVREGLTAVVSVRLPEPQFEGQTKAKLGNSDIKGLVQQVVNDKLAEAFEEDPTTARKI